jgi:hypothetical protein
MIVQFIVDDDDVEMYGSNWQKLVLCMQIDIPAVRYAGHFWQKRGKNEARMAINGYRQNTGIARRGSKVGLWPHCGAVGAPARNY